MDIQLALEIADKIGPDFDVPKDVSQKISFGHCAIWLERIDAKSSY